MTTLAQSIQALEFDTVFYIHLCRCHEDGKVIELSGEYAPSVYLDETDDVDIHGDGWECFTGLTGQYSYNGAVMHSSEYVGEGLTETFTDNADECMFAIVVVYDIDDDEPVGWAIAYKRFDHNC